MATSRVVGWTTTISQGFLDKISPNLTDFSQPLPLVGRGRRAILPKTYCKCVPFLPLRFSSLHRHSFYVVVVRKFNYYTVLLILSAVLITYIYIAYIFVIFCYICIVFR